MSGEILEAMVAAALTAGEAVSEVYATEFTATQKADGSPVTEADKRSEAIIVDALAPLGVPIVAEEAVQSGVVPELGDRFFLVDPLDGTKEFVHRNGEFTVNIALVEAGKPVSGVVLAPALGTLYAGDAAGAFTQEIADMSAGERRRIQVATSGPVNVVASRSHGHAALKTLIEDLGIAEDVSVGSSLKFCLLASGRARLYPRFGPTCEWDTAAGQAVLEAAGGTVIDIDGAPMRYGRPERSFLNPMFVAASDADLAARCATRMRDLI